MYLNFSFIKYFKIKKEVKTKLREVIVITCNIININGNGGNYYGYSNFRRVYC